MICGRDRSKVLKVERVYRESFQFLLQGHHLFLSAEGLKFEFLEHVCRQKRDSVTCLELLLRNVDKGLDDDGFGSLFGMLLVEAIDEVEEVSADFFAEFYSFFYFFAGSRVVLFMEVEVGVHKQFDDLEYFYVVVAAVLDEFIVLYSDIDVWQLFSVPVVEVT